MDRLAWCLTRNLCGLGGPQLLGLGALGHPRYLDALMSLAYRALLAIYMQLCTD